MPHPPRHARIYHHPGVVDGRPTCRWCGERRGKGTRVYCSEACSDEGAVRASGSFSRFKVFERDRGICCRCAEDCEAVAKALRDVRVRAWERGVNSPFWWRIFRALPDLNFSSSWEMNHILPVSEGGGCCGLDNLETLCTACHKAESKAQAGRRSQAKRADAFDRKKALVAEIFQPAGQLEMW